MMAVTPAMSATGFATPIHDREPGTSIEQLALQDRPGEDRYEDADVDPIEGRREVRCVDERGDPEQDEHDEPRAIEHSLGAIALAVEHHARGIDGRGERARGRGAGL